MYKGLERADLSGFKAYRKVGHQLMRPYIEGEDMTSIAVSPTDTPELGGMIAMNPKDPKDIWYVAKVFFADNYERV